MNILPHSVLSARSQGTHSQDTPSLHSCFCQLNSAFSSAWHSNGLSSQSIYLLVTSKDNQYRWSPFSYFRAESLISVTREKHLIKNKCLRRQQVGFISPTWVCCFPYAVTKIQTDFVASLSFDLQQVELPGVSSASAAGSGSGQGKKNSCQFSSGHPVLKKCFNHALGSSEDSKKLVRG